MSSKKKNATGYDTTHADHENLIGPRDGSVLVLTNVETGVAVKHYWPPARRQADADDELIELADAGIVEAAALLWARVARCLAKNEPLPDGLSGWAQKCITAAIAKPPATGIAMRLQRPRGKRTASIDLGDAITRGDIENLAPRLVLNALKDGRANTVRSTKGRPSAASIVAAELAQFQNISGITEVMIEKWFYERKRSDPTFAEVCRQLKKIPS